MMLPSIKCLEIEHFLNPKRTLHLQCLYYSAFLTCLLLLNICNSPSEQNVLCEIALKAELSASSATKCSRCKCNDWQSVNLILIYNFTQISFFWFSLMLLNVPYKSVTFDFIFIPIFVSFYFPLVQILMSVQYYR